MWVFSSSISGWSQVSPIILAFSALRNSKRNSVTQSRPAVNDSSRLMKPFYCLWRNSSTCKVSRKTLSGELTSFKKKKPQKHKQPPTQWPSQFFSLSAWGWLKKDIFHFTEILPWDRDDNRTATQALMLHSVPSVHILCQDWLTGFEMRIFTETHEPMSQNYPPKDRTSEATFRNIQNDMRSSANS